MHTDAEITSQLLPELNVWPAQALPRDSGPEDHGIWVKSSKTLQAKPKGRQTLLLPGETDRNELKQCSTLKLKLPPLASTARATRGAEPAGGAPEPRRAPVPVRSAVPGPAPVPEALREAPSHGRGHSARSDSDEIPKTQTFAEWSLRGPALPESSVNTVSPRSPVSAPHTHISVFFRSGFMFAPLAERTGGAKS